jgi:hypothetical protein
MAAMPMALIVPSACSAARVPSTRSVWDRVQQPKMGSPTARNQSTRKLRGVIETPPATLNHLTHAFMEDLYGLVT